MKERTKALARSGILAAVAVVILYLASLFPSGRLALTAVAGLTGTLAVIHCGGKWAAVVYAVSGALGLLLVPGKACGLLYLLFLGYYPALKSPIERLRRRGLGWALKFAVFNAAAAAVYFLARELLFPDAELPMPLALLWLGGNGVFLVYDLGLTRLIQVYIRRFSGKMKK